jgi:hypothetical protein
MREWPGLAREDVEELAANYWLTVEKVREIAREMYPDDEYEAAQLSQRATDNVRTALVVDLKERGCPPEEVEGWLTAITKGPVRPTGQTDDQD